MSTIACISNKLDVLEFNSTSIDTNTNINSNSESIKSICCTPIDGDQYTSLC